MSSCFVIMPISTPIGSVDYGDPDHFEHVLHHLFKPALERAGYDMVPPSVSNSQIIQAEIILSLETADLVLCDISEWNANVFFELGIRVALDRPVALVKDTKTPNIPFDNAFVSCHTYDASMTPWSLETGIDELAVFVQNAGAQKRNALWKYFGITQRASAPVAGDPVQEKLDLILASLQRPDPPTFSVDAAGFRPGELEPHIWSMKGYDEEEIAQVMGTLNSREQEVLTLFAQGLSNDDVATHLGLSEGTVKTHLARVMAKLGVREKSQAVVAAYQTGLVQPRRGR